MSKADISAKEGCGIVSLAFVLLIVFSVLMISGLAVILMFGWGLIAPFFGLSLLDYPTAWGITLVIWVVAFLVRR